MRGLGMRDPAKHMKNQKRGRPDPSQYDRPNYFMPFGTHGNRHPRRMDSEGLSNNYVERLFDHERVQWPDQGFTSPYENNRGRTARRQQEFNLWLHWHPRRDYVELRMYRDRDRGYGLPYDYNSNSYRRSSHRQSRSIHTRDPGCCPPYPDTGSDYIRGLMNDLAREARRDLRGNDRERHPHPQRPHSARGGSHPPRPFFEPYHDRSRHPPPRHPHENRHRSSSRRHYPRPNPDYPPHIYNMSHPYINPRNYHHPPHEYDDEDDFTDDDLSSQSSTESFTRTPRHHSPHIVYPHPPPYSGYPHGHNRRSSRHGRHETYTDDEDGDDLFKPKGSAGPRAVQTSEQTL